MFNVPLHSRSAIEAHRTRWRVESTQCLRSSHSLTKLVGALIRRHKPYTIGIAKLYEWRESAIGYRDGFAYRTPQSGYRTRRWRYRL